MTPTSPAVSTSLSVIKLFKQALIVIRFLYGLRKFVSILIQTVVFNKTTNFFQVQVQTAKNLILNRFTLNLDGLKE